MNTSNTVSIRFNGSDAATLHGTLTEIHTVLGTVPAVDVTFFSPAGVEIVGKASKNKQKLNEPKFAPWASTATDVITIESVGSGITVLILQNGEHIVNLTGGPDNSYDTSFYITKSGDPLYSLDNNHPNLARRGKTNMAGIYKKWAAN